MFIPGSGVKLSSAIIAGLVAVGLTTGLAVGIGVESSRHSVNTDKLNSLQHEINLARETRREINIAPPNGKGFINN